METGLGIVFVRVIPRLPGIRECVKETASMTADFAFQILNPSTPFSSAV
jgi:hypothetical protein